MSAPSDIDSGDTSDRFDDLLSRFGGSEAPDAVERVPTSGASRRMLRRAGVLRARSLLSAGRIEEAYAAACRLQALEADDTTTRVIHERVKRRRLAEARRQLIDHLPDALAATGKLLADYPRDPATIRLHARALIANRLYAEAERLLAALVGGEEACADDHVQLARIYRVTRAPDRAIGACFRALEIERENVLALHLLRQLLPARSAR